MDRAGIYAIVHVLSGRRYFGQTNSFERRWKQHREALVAGIHHNPRLQEVWESDGELAFEFMELEVAPAYLQPVRLQKWLQQREYELIRSYKARGLAFNIVDAELVETRAAAQAAQAPRVSASAAIYTELQTVKLQMSTLETIVRGKKKVLTEVRSQLILAKSRKNQSVGILRALFGRTNRPEDLENARQIEIATAAVARATEELANCSADLEALLARRKDLHNAYPGNVRRAAVRRRGSGMF
jgi:predicted GIY-YIG superfamily endonuclease